MDPEPVRANPDTPPDRDLFATTHWSVVLQARDANSPQSIDALEQLCRTYWQPLYAYARRAGNGTEDARDLTQGFFLRFLENQWLDRLVHQDGRFRSFLLTFFKRFLSDEYDRTQALKRGRGRVFIPLDAFDQEEREPFEPVDAETPDQAFDRRWLRRLTELALTQLTAENTASGRSALLDAFQELQSQSVTRRSAGELAEKLGMTPAALKSAQHRFRVRHAALLREVASQTVSNPGVVLDELRLLLAPIDSDTA